MTRSRIRTVLTAAACAATVSLGLAGCGATGSASASQHGTLVLYNAQHEQTTAALIAAFEHQTGVNVKVDNDDEDVLTAKIEQEGAASPADLIYTENSNWLEQLDGHGLLAKVDAGALAAVPKADSAADGRWVGVSARVAELVYNRDKLSAAQLPSSVLDLADASWKGRIEIAPAETDFWPVVASVDRAVGDQRTLAWLAGLKANAGSNDNVPDNETLTSDVSEGQAQLALINHYYFYRLEAEVGSASVRAGVAHFAAGDPGYVEGISGAAVLKSSKHAKLAQEFLQFLTSASGQAVLAQGESFEYPIRPGVAANPELPPLSSLHPNDFSPADLGTGMTAKRLLQQAGLI